MPLAAEGSQPNNTELRRSHARGCLRNDPSGRVALHFRKLHSREETAAINQQCRILGFLRKIEGA
jgi:hypothetical protein